MLNKDKIVKVAERVVSILQNYEFDLDMGEFNSQLAEKGSGIVAEPVCGTSFCLVGYMAHLDGYPEEYRYFSPIGLESFRHYWYSLDLLGFRVHMEGKAIETLEAIWAFLFHSAWQDDKELAMSRARFVIDNIDAVTSLAHLLPSPSLTYAEELDYLLGVYKACIRQ